MYALRPQCSDGEGDHIKRLVPTHVNMKILPAKQSFCCLVLLVLMTSHYIVFHFHYVRSTPAVVSEFQTREGKTRISSNLHQEPFDRLSFLTWEMHPGSQKIHQIGRRPRLLIAQTVSNFYTPLLVAGQPVNQAYARAYGHDYVVARGIYLVDERRNETQMTAPDSRAAYNKIALLSYALREGKYDKLLVLDSDAIIRDFDVDFATYGYDPDILLFAQSVGSGNPTNYWDVNNGVTLWNLRHDSFVSIWFEWYRRSVEKVYRGFRDEDQSVLHEVLKEMPDESRPVRGVNYFCCVLGSLIQHFPRTNHRVFTVMADSRLQSLKAAANATFVHYAALINRTATED
jgi:hypothetical protein